MIKNIGKLTLIAAIAYSIISPTPSASAQRIRLIEKDDDIYERDYRYDDDYRRGDWKYRYDDDDYDYDDDYDDDDRGYRELPRHRYHRRFERRDEDKYGLYGRELICKSTPRGFTRCNADIRDRDLIRLRRQLYNSNRCREGDTWGFDRRGLWVSDGCQAVFEILP